MNAALLLAVVVGVVSAQVEVPLGALQGVRNAGLQTINDRINSDNQRLVDALEAFKPINASCNALVNAAVSKCTSCVENKCKARAQSVCKPEKWQEILGKTIGFFKDGIPGFFSRTIPDIFVNKIGGGIVDVTKDVGDFFKDKIGGGIVDFGKKVGDGIVNVGKGAIDGIVNVGKKIGNGVVDIGKKIGNGVVDVGKKIGSGVSKAVDGIKNIGKSIGKALGGIFGRRELVSVSRRAAEPSCGDFERNAEEACKFYLKPQYCSDCSFDANAKCAGYKAATDAIAAANRQRKWMTTIQKQNYDIVKMTFNPAAISPTGAFKNVVVSVNLFGKDIRFTLAEPINPYIPTTAGPVIARRALQEYIKHA